MMRSTPFSIDGVVASLSPWLLWLLWPLLLLPPPPAAPAVPLLELELLLLPPAVVLPAAEPEAVLLVLLGASELLLSVLCSCSLSLLLPALMRTTVSTLACATCKGIQNR